jgi:hypothetical protein
MDSALLVRDQLQASRWRAIIWIAALQVLDIVTTYTAIKWAGASEGNPVTVWLVESYMIVVAKAAVVSSIIWFAVKRPATVRSTSLAWWSVGMYVMAIVVNTMHLVRA